MCGEKEQQKKKKETEPKNFKKTRGGYFVQIFLGGFLFFVWFGVVAKNFSGGGGSDLS